MIFLTQRGDRYGAHFICNICEFLLSKYYNVKLYYNRNYKIGGKIPIKNTLYFYPILKQSIPIDENIKSTIKYSKGVRGPAATFVQLVKQDVISYFNQNFKENMYSVLKEEAAKKNFKLPWDNTDNIVCIHIRLEDISNRKDYNGMGSFNYVKNLIDNNDFIKYDRKKSDSYSLDTQAPIKATKLIDLINKINTKYPEKTIYLITYCKKIPKWLGDIIALYNLKIFHKNDMLFDLWLMIHSNILILSKSTFSLIAGIYHQGQEVYYPYWGTFASFGLGSKYDKSSWIGYV